MGKKTLNRYYTLTDASETYRITMSKFSWICRWSVWGLPVLHPQHKLAYFAKAGWEPAWITTAQEIIQTEFERSYTSKPCKANEESTATAKQKVFPPHTTPTLTHVCSRPLKIFLITSRPLHRPSSWTSLNATFWLALNRLTTSSSAGLSIAQSFHACPEWHSTI